MRRAMYATGFAVAMAVLGGCAMVGPGGVESLPQPASIGAVGTVEQAGYYEHDRRTVATVTQFRRINR